MEPIVLISELLPHPFFANLHLDRLINYFFFGTLFLLVASNVHPRFFGGVEFFRASFPCILLKRRDIPPPPLSKENFPSAALLVPKFIFPPVIRFFVRLPAICVHPSLIIEPTSSLGRPPLPPLSSRFVWSRPLVCSQSTK